MNASPTCMPSTLLMRLDMVCRLLLLELLAMPFTRVKRLDASVTNCSVLLVHCVVTDTDLLLDENDSLRAESSIAHVPLVVLLLMVAVKVLSLLKVSVIAPAVMPYFSSDDCRVLSILLAAALAATFDRTLSDSKTMAGSE